jgi:hypothetical protein
MIKKMTAGVVCLFFLLAFSLFLTSKISDAYATATEKILNDPALSKEYGTQQYTVLVGSRFKLGSEWSCARLLFVLNGTEGSGIVKVLLRRKRLHDAWEVRDVTLGYNTEPKTSCGAAA